MAAYAYALDEEAVLVFASLPTRQRVRLLRRFDRLGLDPFVRGHLQESGETGRTYELTLEGNILITWWADHAAREVRIIRLEQVG